MRGQLVMVICFACAVPIAVAGCGHGPGSTATGDGAGGSNATGTGGSSATGTGGGSDTTGAAGSSATGAGGASATGSGGAPFDVSPFVGIWKGKTQPQNRDVTFQITANGLVGGFTTTISFSLAGGTCTAPFVAASLVHVTGPALAFPISYQASDLVPTVHIDLATDTASGTISASDGGFAACGNTLTIGTGIGTSRQTFTATRCANCSVPTCTFQGDGDCDEPGAGTGLCFLGTDTADCSGAATGTGGMGGGAGTGAGGSGAPVVTDLGEPCTNSYCTPTSSWCYESGSATCDSEWCVGSGTGSHCSKACASDADCLGGAVEMRCLTKCSLNGPAIAGHCWDVSTYAAVSSACGQ